MNRLENFLKYKYILLAIMILTIFNKLLFSKTI